MSNNTGGPAFPIEINSEMTCLGMTLRDYFAAKAMLAMLAHPNSSDTAGPESFATAAYTMADAMLKARQA
jgi:hypothetical protein